MAMRPPRVAAARDASATALRISAPRAAKGRPARAVWRRLHSRLKRSSSWVERAAQHLAIERQGQAGTIDQEELELRPQSGWTRTEIGPGQQLAQGHQARGEPGREGLELRGLERLAADLEAHSPTPEEAA